jgi:hypothetical protein
VLIEFETHPRGDRVAVESRQVVAVLRARGGLPFTLIRLSGGRDVVVRGTKAEVMERLELTEDIRGSR